MMNSFVSSRSIVLGVDADSSYAIIVKQDACCFVIIVTVMRTGEHSCAKIIEVMRETSWRHFMRPDHVTQSIVVQKGGCGPFIEQICSATFLIINIALLGDTI